MSRPSKSERRHREENCDDAEPTESRSGFVSLVGRPNVGKSTLTNALVGEKIAITSSKPQTTRHTIRGITNRPGGQLILVDTPGIHRPRTLLGERLNALVKATLGDVDVIGMCFPANEPVGSGDNFIKEQLDQFPHSQKVAIITKIDQARGEQVSERIAEVKALRDWAFVIPVSASRGENVAQLADQLIALLPTGQALYLDDENTDEDIEKRVSELIREVILEDVRDELPHSLAVTLDDMIEREDSQLIDIYANVFVERDSQKAIIIGKGGSRLKEIGTQARASIEALLGRKIFLSIRVKVAKDWQRDPKQLQKLGF